MKVSVGKYRWQEGDDPFAVAVKLYNDRHKAVLLLNANDLSEVQVGDVIDVPNFTGTLVTAAEGEQFPTLHRRAVGNPAAAAAALADFKKWNGDRMVEAGETVFFVDQRRKSYGY